MASVDNIPVEIVAALPGRQLLLKLTVPVGTTARESILLADIDAKIPGLNAARCEIAIWGRHVTGDHVLMKNDRVEVLRPLQIDPRDARRRLASEGQVMGVVKKPRAKDPNGVPGP